MSSEEVHKFFESKNWIVSYDDIYHIQNKCKDQLKILKYEEFEENGNAKYYMEFYDGRNWILHCKNHVKNKGLTGI